MDRPPGPGGQRALRGPGGRSLTADPEEAGPTSHEGGLASDARSRVPRPRLLSAIALLGLTSLGGWPSYYHDDMVVRRRWLTDHEYLEGNALSNAVPGPVFTNLTIYVAYRLGGWLSVVLGLALVLLPGAAAMLALTLWYDWNGPGVGHDPLVTAGLKGLGAGAAAFTAVTPVRLLQASAVGRRGLAVAAIGFVTMGLFGYGLLAVVPPLALLAVWLERPRGDTSA